MKIAKLILPIILIGLCSATIYAETPKNNTNIPLLNQNLYGLIEIGASGIKPIILQVFYKQGTYKIKKKGKIKTEISYDILERAKIKSRNSFHVESIPKISKDLKIYIKKFQIDFNIPRDNIFIVGSSGVAQASHKEDLQKSVKNSTGIKMEFISVEDESKYVFNGILELIPKARGQQNKRRKQAIVIDIGSGNTKGGYYNPRTKKVETFNMQYGTKTFSVKVENDNGKEDFSTKSKKLGRNLLRPIIKQQIKKHPGLMSRDRIYLIGGLPWATTTLLSLDSPTYQKRSAYQSTYTVMKLPKDSENLYKQLTDSKETINTICNDNKYASYFTKPDNVKKRKKISRKICDGIFNINQLIGGLEILNTLSTELKFNKKKVFFMQDSLYAWPLGYIKDKIKKNKP